MATARSGHAFNDIVHAGAGRPCPLLAAAILRIACPRKAVDMAHYRFANASIAKVPCGSCR